MPNTNCPNCGRTLRVNKTSVTCNKCHYYSPLPKPKSEETPTQETPKQEPPITEVKTETKPIYTTPFKANSTHFGSFDMTSYMRELSQKLDAQIWGQLSGNYIGRGFDVAKPPPPKRPQTEIILEAINRLCKEINEIEEEKEYQLSMAYTLFHQRKVARTYDERLDRKRGELLELETKYGHLKDELNETPEDAALRDGTAMRLLNW